MSNEIQTKNPRKHRQAKQSASRIITGFFLQVFILISCGCAARSQNNYNMFLVDVPRSDLYSPDLKEVACRYTAKVVAKCEAYSIFPPSYDESMKDNEEYMLTVALAESEKVDGEAARREPTHLRTCMNREMSHPQAKERLACIQTARNCLRLHRCVGSEYKKGDSTVEGNMHYKFWLRNDL